ncbi:uncharacterized protein LOC144874171 isoform X2 [Branchiostoma floridae x Branchiostoma japonicum]
MSDRKRRRFLKRKRHLGTLDGTVEETMDGTVQKTMDGSHGTVQVTMDGTIQETIPDSRDAIPWGLKLLLAVVKLILTQECVRIYTQNASCTVEETMDGTVEETMDGTVEETMDGTVEETMDGTVEETMDGTVEETMDGTVEETMEGSHRTVQVTMDGTVQETMEGAAVTPQAPTGVWNRILSIWQSKPVQIQLLRIALILHIAGFVMDIVLATRYYYSGDYHWFGWTVVFLFAPSLVMSVRSELETVDNNVSRCDSLLLNILQLAMPMRYFDILQMLSSDRGMEETLMSSLYHAHFLISMFKNMPQLCLKIYIIHSTKEQVNVLNVISMVISLVLLVKASVTYMYQLMRHSIDEQSNLKLVIMLLIWKVSELSARVLAIGLGASIMKKYTLVMWTTTSIMIMEWLLLASPTAIEIPIPYSRDVIQGGLLMAVVTFFFNIIRGYLWMYTQNASCTVHVGFIMGLAIVSALLNEEADWNHPTSTEIMLLLSMVGSYLSFISILALVTFPLSIKSIFIFLFYIYMSSGFMVFLFAFICLF